MDRSQLKEVDELALQYKQIAAEKTFTAILNIAEPDIVAFSRRYTIEREDQEDLAQILRLDLFHLLRDRWKVDGDKSFHWIMLRQFKNKCLNFCKKGIKESEVKFIEMDRFFHLGTPPGFDDKLQHDDLVEFIHKAIDTYTSPIFQKKDHIVIDMTIAGFNGREIKERLNYMPNSLTSSLKRTKMSYKRAMFSGSVNMKT